jgi:hypothetical protein
MWAAAQRVVEHDGAVDDHRSARTIPQSPPAHADQMVPCGAAGAMASLTPQNGRATLPREVANMARPMESGAKRPRISIDVQPQIRGRLRLAAARRDLTIRRYMLQGIEDRLREDLGDDAEGIGGLTASADPVLAGLWDNRKDAEYDRL